MGWFSPGKLQVQQKSLGSLSQWPSLPPSAKDQSQSTGGRGLAVLIRQMRTTFKAAQCWQQGVYQEGLKG